MDVNPFMPPLGSNTLHDGMDNAEEQHLAFLQSQLVQPSPIQPPHHDHLSMPSTPQQRSVGPPSVIQSTASPAAPTKHYIKCKSIVEFIYTFTSFWKCRSFGSDDTHDSNDTRDPRLNRSRNSTSTAEHSVDRKPRL